MVGQRPTIKRGALRLFGGAVSSGNKAVGNQHPARHHIPPVAGAQAERVFETMVKQKIVR